MENKNILNYYGFLLVSFGGLLITLLIMFPIWVDYYKLEHGGLSTWGKITSVYEEESSESTDEYLSINYTVNGKEYYYKIQNHEGLGVNDTVRIIYLADDPNVADISGLREKSFDSKAGVGMFILCLCSLILSVKFKRWLISQEKGMWPI